MTQSDEPQEAETRLTISAEGMPLLYFLRWVTDQAGISIVAEQNLDDADVSIDVIDVPVSQLMGVLARRLNVDVTRTGDLFYLGNLRAEDRGVLVRKVPRLTGEQLADAVEVLLSDNGRVQAFDDGLVLVGDTVEVLSRVDEMLDGVAAAALDSWILQLYVVSLSERAEHDIGLDAIPAADFAATFALASGGDNNAATTLLTGGLDAFLTATRTVEGASLIADPTFVLVDGGTSSISRIERFPIRNTTEDQDTNTTTSEVEFIDIGMQYNVQLRDVGSARASVSIDIELSSIAGFVDDLPREQAETFNTTAIMRSGGVYYVGGVNRTENRRRLLGIMGTREDLEDSSGRLMVWARAYRIAPVENTTLIPVEPNEANADPGDQRERKPAPRQQDLTDEPAGEDIVLPDPEKTASEPDVVPEGDGGGPIAIHGREGALEPDLADRYHVARELAERDGRGSDDAYIEWLATGRWPTATDD